MPSFPPVLILAGGLGTRVESLYPNAPKAMIPVKGKPFIDHQLSLLAKQSVKEVILCVGHRCQSIVDYVGTGNSFGINVRYSYDGETLLGTGGALLKAQSSCHLNAPFAVMYGDSYLDTDFSPIYDAFLQSKKMALMTVFKNNNQWIPSNIICRLGLVRQYDKEKSTADMQYVDYGLSIFNPQVFDRFTLSKTFDLVDVWQTLIRENQLAAYEVNERFYEAGTPDGLRELMLHLNEKIDKLII